MPTTAIFQRFSLCREIALLFLTAGLLGACGGDKDEDSGDTGTAEEGWFTEAVLDPPFEHGNAIWSGVALLDFDGDDLLDIYFPNGTSHPDALYRNLGDGTFEDVASAAGLDSLERHGAAAAGDIDNDGDEDLVVSVECTSGTLYEDGRAIGDGGTVIYENLGDGTFGRRVPTMHGNSHTRGYCPVSVELADVNGDGFLDLLGSNGLDPDQAFPWIYVKSVSEAQDHVWLNDGQGDFDTEVDMVEPGSTDPTYNAYVTFSTVALDLNADGRMDRINGQGGAPLQPYLQDEAGLFQWDYDSTYVGDGLWMGLAVADYDGDGDLDMYATNQGLSPLMAGYDNIPEAQTREIENPPVDPLEAGLINPFHALILNEDGVLQQRTDWPLEAEGLLAGDLFDGYPDPESGEPRYPTWMEPEGLQRYPWAWGAVALDVDADGYSDVAFTGNNCSPPMDIVWEEERGAGPGGLLLNLEGEGFRDVTWEVGVENVDGQGRYMDGRGIAVGDLNGDGYADLVYANRTYNPTQSDPIAQEPGRPRVFLSGARENRFLVVELVGSTSNAQGLGSTVWLTLPSGRRAHALGMGGGTNSSSERALILGAGQAEDVDLEVLFPSGVTVLLEDVETNQRIVVEEP